MKGIKGLAASLIIGASLLTGCSEKAPTEDIKAVVQQPTVQIEIYKTSENENGFLFHDPTAEFEPDIFVDMQAVEEWKLQDLQDGQKVIGVFDETGWELLDVIKVVQTHE